MNTMDVKKMDVGTVWWFWFNTSAFFIDKRLRHIMRFLPSDPRCKFCNAPFRGIGGLISRVVFNKHPSTLNPRFCDMCDAAMQRFPGGAEVEMSILFADIRGSTALSTQMSASQFGGLINRFYGATAKAINDEDGLVEKLAGDSVSAFWGAGFAGPDYVHRTLEVAKRISTAMQREQIPVGIGVHSGVAFFGAVASPDGLCNLTGVGEEVNVAARLAAQAGAGEIIVSEPALAAAGEPADGLESRTLELKGIQQPVPVRVIHGSVASAA